MITLIEINNFRSIESEVVSLDRPLTVIVGPNGVGKTNLLLALRFLKNAVSMGPVRAIQMAGGLDQVFRMKARRTRECSIKVNVRIENPIPYRLGPFFEKDENMVPIYGKEISYEFGLSYSSEQKTLEVKSEIVTDLSFGEGRIIYDRQKASYENSSSQSKEDFSSRLFLNSIDFLFAKEGYFSKQDSQIVNFVQSELSSLDDYNLNPFSLRSSSDLLSIEDLKYDGSGLSSYLYRLQRARGGIFRGTFFSRVGNPEAWKDLRERFPAVIPFVEKISFNEDISSTKVDLKIKEINSTRLHNVGQVSDGTLKYIALVGRIVTADYSMIGLEEVENCLHPKAIRELIDLIGDIAQRFHCQFVLTSHSETVLNQVDIESILLATRSEGGATTYRIPKNIHTLQNELEAGGFGLGTYWGSHEGVE